MANTLGLMLAVGIAGLACGRPAPPRIMKGLTGKPDREIVSCVTAPTFTSAEVSALEGLVVDCETGEALSDVIVVIDSQDGKFAAGATTDRNGRYRVELQEGTYNLAMVTSGADLEFGVEVKAGHITFKESRLDIRSCPPSSANKSSTADRDALVAAVLLHYAEAPRNMIDGGLLPEHGPIYVAGDGVVADLLPARNTRPLVVRSRADLQREANRLHQDVPYIAIKGIDMIGDCATVDVGPDLELPEQRGGKLCCCRQVDIYRKHGDRWYYRASKSGICS